MHAFHRFRVNLLKCRCLDIGMAASHVSAMMNSQKVAQCQEVVQTVTCPLPAGLQACYCLHSLVNGNAEAKMAGLNMLGLSTTASSKHVLASISNVILLLFVNVFWFSLDSHPWQLHAMQAPTTAGRSRQNPHIHIERWYTKAHFSYTTRETICSVPVHCQAALHCSCHAQSYTRPDPQCSRCHQC